MTTQACPDCEAVVPLVPGYVSWCDACGWNLSAPPVPQPGTRIERLEARAAGHLGRRVTEQLATRATLEPHLTAAKVGAYAVALVVHLVPVALVVAAIVIAAWGGFGVGADVLALLLLLPIALLRPRLGRLGDDDRVVDPSAAPTLHRLIGEIAAAGGGPVPDVVVVDAEHNASWSTVGWRRRRVLRLGLPLLAHLSPQERAALIAHELAHGRHGDVTRGVFVGGAVRSLGELYYVLRPYERARGDAVLVNWFFWLVSRPLWWLLIAEFTLLRRESQRAEYLADAVAARVAGSDAVVALHEQLLLDSPFRGAVQAASRDASLDVFDRLRASRDVPERERERRRRVARLEAASLGATHPPTAQRIDLVERRGPHEPLVVVKEAESEAVDEELRPFRRPLQEELVERYRATLYA